MKHAKSITRLSAGALGMLAGATCAWGFGPRARPWARAKGSGRALGPPVTIYFNKKRIEFT